MAGFVMNAVCLLFGLKEDWVEGKKLLGKLTFLEDLKDFNTDTVPSKKW